MLCVMATLTMSTQNWNEDITIQSRNIIVDIIYVNYVHRMSILLSFNIRPLLSS